jgi:putative PIN family toxin of toxin-antitoxin system
MTSTTVNLKPDTGRKLRERASSIGMELEVYVAQPAEHDAGTGAKSRNRAPFDEIDGPLAEAIGAAGMSDEELATYFARAVKDVRAEKRSKKRTGRRHGSWYDTVTLLQAAANPRGPAGIGLRMAVEDLVALHMSIDGLQEPHDVLSRDDVRGDFPSLTDDRVETFLEGLRETVLIVATVPPAFRYARDPDDEHILDLAIASEARFLVTHDKDLLDLMNAENPEGRSFRKLTPRLAIPTPPDFLRVWGEAEG